MARRKRHKIQLIDKTEYKEFRVRFYGRENCRLLEEFINKIKVTNLGKSLEKREYANSIFAEVIIAYIKNKTVVQEETTVAKIVTPVVKEATKSSLNALAELINYQSDIINKQLEKNAELNSFIARWVALQADISQADFDIKKNAELFKVPSWFKK